MYLSDLERPFWMLSDWLVANQNDLLKVGSCLSIYFPAYHFARYRSYLLPEYWPLALYLGLTCVVETVGVFTMYSEGGNMWLYNPYALVELALIAWLYRRFCYLPFFCSFIKWSAIVMCAAGVLSLRNNFFDYNKFVFTWSAILVSIYSAMYFIDAFITRRSGLNLLMLCFTVGAVFFYPNTQAAFYFGDELARRPAGLADIWNAVLTINITYHCFITAGILSLSDPEA